MASQVSYLDTGKLVILCYPPGAGGKFVSNCLALSQQVFPQVRNPTNPLWLLTKLLQEGSLKYRLSYVLTSLPKEKEEMRNWKTKYEFNAMATFGYTEMQLEKRGVDFVRTHITNNPHPLARIFFKKLHESSYLHFQICHKPKNLALYRELFPNCQQIIFRNTMAWRRKAQATGKTDGIKGGQEFGCDDGCFPNNVEFDTGRIMQESGFLDEVEKLYLFFGLPDFNEGSIAFFYRKYMELHSLLSR